MLSGQPMFKGALLSLLHAKPEEEGEGEEEKSEGYQRFIPLLLFLVQKKETVIPAKLCVMVRRGYGVVIILSLLDHT